MPYRVRIDGRPLEPIRTFATLQEAKAAAQQHVGSKIHIDWLGFEDPWQGVTPGDHHIHIDES
jgi:hypothetical protein